jgi:hypothetical protein
MSRTFWSSLIGVHDSTAFHNIGLGVPGVRWYPDRALLAPFDAVVIEEGIDPSYLAWLKSPGVDLGPKRVIQVKGSNLYEGLEADPGAFEAVLSAVRHEARVQPFVVTREATRFFKRYGLMEKVHGPPLEISHQMNDKARFRKIVEEAGFGHALLPYHASRERPVIERKVREYLAKPPAELDFVVSKLTNLAGGYGMLFLHRDDPSNERKLAEYLDRHHRNDIVIQVRKKEKGNFRVLEETRSREKDEVMRQVAELLRRPAEDVTDVIVWRVDLFGGDHAQFDRGTSVEARLSAWLSRHLDNEIIVEYGREHAAYSTQVMIENDAPPRFLGLTRQLMDGSHHIGNALTRYHDPTRVSREAYIVMKEITCRLAEYSSKRITRFIGTQGYDFLMCPGPPDGEVYVTECNARVTAATYPIAVSKQLEGRRSEATIGEPNGGINWGVKMYNAVPTSCRSFAELKERLGARSRHGRTALFQGTYGAIPFNIRLMGLDSPCCGIVAVGDSIQEAEALMDDVREIMA